MVSTPKLATTKLINDNRQTAHTNMHSSRAGLGIAREAHSSIERAVPT